MMLQFAEMLAQAELRLEAGDLDNAARLFEQAHELNPRSPAGALGMATVAARLGQFQDSLAILGKILEKFPAYARAVELRQWILERAG